MRDPTYAFNIAEILADALPNALAYPDSSLKGEDTERYRIRRILPVHTYGGAPLTVVSASNQATTHPFVHTTCISRSVPAAVSRASGPY